MSERKKYDTGSVKVEKMLKEKRRGLGNKYKTREKLLNLEVLNCSITTIGSLHVIWQILDLEKAGSVLKD